MQPTTDTPEVLELVRSVPGWADVEPSITPLEGGITNRNYRIEVEGESFVLRLPGRDTELLGIDRRAELEATRRAAEAGVGPPVFAFLEEPGCLVTRFVTGSPIPQDDLETERVLEPVVTSVLAIHACPPIAASFPVFRIVEDYRRIAAERGVQIPAAHQDASELAGRIEAAFARAPMPLTTCHNDLLNANFLLDDGHVWIVDYEYAGMGDPFFDLGNLSINNGLSAEAQELLLRLYFGSVHDGHRARLSLMRIVSDFREAMWGVVQQGLSTLDFDYVDYAERHFRRLLRTADDERFEGWLEAAGNPV